MGILRETHRIPPSSGPAMRHWRTQKMRNSLLIPDNREFLRKIALAADAGHADRRGGLCCGAGAAGLREKGSRGDAEKKKVF
jgi:hypothetical protein